MPRIDVGRAWRAASSRNTERLLDLFDEHAVRGTFFVLGWVAERHPDLVRAIAARGHEIASHGYAHRLVYDQTPDGVPRRRAPREGACSRTSSGGAVDGYRAPSFSVTPRSLWALDVLIEEGYRYDASIFPIRHDRYGIPDRAALAPRDARGRRRAGRSAGIDGPRSAAEPAGRRRRLLPHPAVRLDAVGHRPPQPGRGPAGDLLSAPLGDRSRSSRVCRASVLGRFRHYRNLHLTERRLRALLRDFAFGPLDSVLSGCAA